MIRPEDLKVKIFADGADLAAIAELSAHPLVRGFTTNPTLMRKAGVADYADFAAEVLRIARGRPVSFEALADEFDEMEREARVIASWGANVFVKIPVTNTRGEPSAPLVRRLQAAGVKVNVTAILTLEQVRTVAAALDASIPAVVSVFAGRIADTGRDPVPVMREAKTVLADLPRAELLWASPREVLNVVQANEVGCHVITVTQDLLARLGTVGKDLAEYSLETVRMFHRDAAAAGYTVRTKAARAAE